MTSTPHHETKNDSASAPLTGSADAVQPTRLVVLGTGGTIAGRSSNASDNVGYRAGSLGVADLLAHAGLADRIPAAWQIEFEQVAQVDSKDMSHAVWRRLAERCQHHLDRPAVTGVVVTHGTDTLEETGYLLQRVLAPTKPLVLTAAMRPATALLSDGPQNLLEALTLAATPGVRGAVVCLGGVVWAGDEARKVHPYRLEAFSAGDAGPLAYLEEGRLRTLRAWPATVGLGVEVLAPEVWPSVEVILSHAGSEGALAQWAVDAGVQGLVVGCTGNGTVHDDLLAVLLRARQRGVEVLRALRSGAGCIVDSGTVDLPHAGALTPAQARVELLLRLLARR